MPADQVLCHVSLHLHSINKPINVVEKGIIFIDTPIECPLKNMKIESNQAHKYRGCGVSHPPNLLLSRKILRQSEIQAYLETPFARRLEFYDCHSCLLLSDCHSHLPLIIIATIIYTYFRRLAKSGNIPVTYLKVSVN